CRRRSTCRRRPAEESGAPSEVDPELRGDALLERMLHRLHLRHEVGHRHELVRRVATRDHHVNARRARTERREHIVLRDEAVVNRVRKLIEDHDVELSAQDELLGLLPGRDRGGLVLREVVAVPREPAAHHEERQIGERLGEDPLAGLPLAFDELHDANAHAAAQCAKDDPERGRRLALALARIDHEQPSSRSFLDAFPGVGHARLLASRAATTGCGPDPIARMRSRTETTSPMITMAGAEGSTPATRTARSASVPTTTVCAGVVADAMYAAGVVGARPARTTASRFAASLRDAMKRTSVPLVPYGGDPRPVLTALRPSASWRPCESDG